MKICLMMALLMGAAVAQYPSHISGTNYQTADQSRQEVVDLEGNVQGQYSYLDPSTGHTISVKYTAGNAGYQVQPQLNQEQLQNIPEVDQFQQKRYLNTEFNQDIPIPQQLFTPARDPYPAATAAQIRNMQQILSEEAQMDEANVSSSTQSNPASPRTHVSVHSPYQGYSYEINL